MKDLILKLSEVQSKLKAPKGKYNGFGKYNYRKCEDILEAVKPLLFENALFLYISDEIEIKDSRVYVKAIATVTDGVDSISVNGYAREPLSKKGMDESQVTGASSSYARKYALNGLFGIDDSNDADDADNSEDTQLEDALSELSSANTEADVKRVWDSYLNLHGVKSFVESVKKRKAEVSK